MTRAAHLSAIATGIYGGEFSTTGNGMGIAEVSRPLRHAESLVNA